MRKYLLIFLLGYIFAVLVDIVRADPPGNCKAVGALTAEETAIKIDQYMQDVDMTQDEPNKPGSAEKIKKEKTDRIKAFGFSDDDVKACRKMVKDKNPKAKGKPFKER